MIKTRQIVLAAAIAASFAASAYAADKKIVLAALDDVSGKVLINKGKGFVSAKSGMEVRPGDRIIALDNASAKIVYNDGCATDLKENNLLAIDGKGCGSKPVNSRSNHLMLAQAIGGAEPEITDSSKTIVAAGTTGNSMLIGGSLLKTGAVVGGGLLLAGYAIHKDNQSVSGQ